MNHLPNSIDKTFRKNKRFTDCLVNIFSSKFLYIELSLHKNPSNSSPGLFFLKAEIKKFRYKCALR